MLAKRWKTAALSSAFVDLFGGGAPDPKAPPTEFRIFPAGKFSTRKGEFLFDDQAAASVMAGYQQHGVDLMIDYDHAALAAPAVRAIAAGWFNLEMRNGELWAVNVRWTPDGAEHLSKGEYRYFSPLFNAEEKTGRITDVIDNALTNTPAIDNLPALVAASTHAKESEMDPELKKAQDRVAELERQSAAKDDEIRALKGQTVAVALSTTLGLSTGAAPEQIRTEVVALAAFRRDVLALAGTDSAPAAIGALTAMREQAKESVALSQKLELLETAGMQAEFETVMKEATTSGRIPPAKEHPRHAFALSCSGAATGKLTRDGLVALRAYVGTLDPLVSNGGGAGGGGTRAPAGGIVMTEQQKKLAQSLRISDKEWQEAEARRLGVNV